MSNTDKNVIEHAEKVIEKFGGIRPMATKMDVPVTTVQGWKKRNVIPARRRAQIIEAAQTHDIDLSDLIDGISVANDVDEHNVSEEALASVAKEDVKSEGKSETVIELSKKPTSVDVKGEDIVAPKPRKPRHVDGDLDKRLAESRKSAVTQSTYINLFLISVSIGALLVVFWPKVETAEQSNKRITVLEHDVETVKQEQSMFRGLKLESRLQDLQQQTARAQEGLTRAISAAAVVSQEVLEEKTQNFKGRIAELETNMGALNASPSLAGLLARVKDLESSLPGREQLAQSTSALGSVVSGFGGQMSDLNSALDEARAQDPVLGQTLEGVPRQDLKAAALLLGLSQFRSALNRDGQPFGDDLALLMRLVDPENAPLLESLERLSPHAEAGVLTPSGLSEELRSLTGDIVVSSLKGEDVSIKEKAKARLNDVLQVEKDGELVTGTQTQAAISKTQSLLEAGDLEGAIASIKTLDGNAASAALPWLEKANGALIAQRVQRMLTQSMQGTGGSIGGITAGGIKSNNILSDGIGAIGGGSRLITDEATGIRILRPAKTFGQ